MPDVTVVIPVGPKHDNIVHRAVASVQNQTVPTAYVVVPDADGNGAGWTRNRGIEQVTTPFVTFLDADDWLEDAFVARTLAVRPPMMYVYTDWYEGEKIKVAPEHPWCAGQWHVVTALLPTQWVKAIGGFDENLPGAEDTDFWLKLTTARRCGFHLKEPLMHYTKGEQSRAEAFAASEQHDLIMSEISRRYRGKVGCCGDKSAIEQPVGEKQENDVLVSAIWAGNMIKFGPITGRQYPRSGNGKQMWVDPRDMARRPDWWRAVELEEPTVDEPALVIGVDQIAAAMMNDWRQRQPRPAPQRVQGDPADYRPNVSNVVNLAQKARNGAAAKPMPAPVAPVKAMATPNTQPLVAKAKRGRPAKKSK